MKGINIVIKVIHCKSKQSTRFRQLQRQIHADWNKRLTYFRAREGCEGHSQWACVSPSLLLSLLPLRSACVEEKNTIVFLSHDVIFSCRSDKNLSYRRKYDNIYTIWSRLVMHLTAKSKWRWKSLVGKASKEEAKAGSSNIMSYTPYRQHLAAFKSTVTRKPCTFLWKYKNNDWSVSNDISSNKFNNVRTASVDPPHMWNYRVAYSLRSLHWRLLLERRK